MPCASLAATFTAARSVDASTLRTWASWYAPLSLKRTWTCLLSPTTCALVTIVPLLSTRKPVPDPWLVRTDATLGLAAA
jgi:hypothetical protein